MQCDVAGALTAMRPYVYVCVCVGAGTPETPCASFLNKYNKVEETLPKGIKAKAK